MKSIKVNKNKDFLKKLPKKTGVYLFLNKKKKVIYVGRAANLKTRISSYFLSVGSRTSNRRPVEQFVGEVEKVSFVETNNLLESAVLENNLIKKYWPKYNIKDKDHKSFVYLFFNMNKDFPKPVVVRERDLKKYGLPRSAGKPKNLVGPFQSVRELKNILSVARRIYPYSTCVPLASPAEGGKPCFHNQIGLCAGVCTREINSKEYKKIIRGLIRFLKSKNPKTNRKFLDDIVLIPHSTQIMRSHKICTMRIEGYDISQFGKGDVYGSMAVFINRKASKKDYRLFKIKSAGVGDDTGALREVLERRLKHKEWQYPDIIVVDGGRQQVNTFLKILKNVNLEIPVVGISKAGKHSQSSAKDYNIIFSAKLKKSVREMFSAQKDLFLKVDAEAHRFAIKQVRKNR